MVTSVRMAAGFVSAIGLVLLAGCGGAGTPAAQPSSLPDGWRWESFMGVQVGVPNAFGWGGSGQALDQWCVSDDRSALVGRPFGVSTLVACSRGAEGRPGPETQIANTGPIVAFEFDREIPEAGDRTVIKHGDVSLIIQVKEPLRSRIAKTVRFVDGTDWAGCPTSDPINSRPFGSPEHGVDVSRIRDVDDVSVCRYGVGPGNAPGLLASTVISGTDAEDAIAAIAAAPKGSGPNRPDNCTPGLMDQVVVLHIRAGGRESRIHARYDDCDKVGFDDGVAVRRLTKAGLSRILVGPHRQDSWDGHLDGVIPTR